MVYTNGNRIYTIGGRAVYQADPYNPLGLPPYTIRLKFTEGVTPAFSYGNATQVSASPNVWDLTYENSDWTRLLSSQTNLQEVLGANTSGVTIMNLMFYKCFKLTEVPLFDTGSMTDMSGMFRDCISLTEVPLSLFDTGSVTSMYRMFNGCISLTEVPLFDTDSLKNMYEMFKGCYHVKSGALALYRQASTQATPPTVYGYCFTDCGSGTDTGEAELAQIPTSWGGTMG